MISGLYLGDIGRLSLQEVFDFTVPKIESRDLSVPIFDRTSDLVNLDLWLKSKHGLKLDLNQRRAWKRVCQSVVYRSADLATSTLHLVTSTFFFGLKKSFCFELELLV